MMDAVAPHALELIEVHKRFHDMQALDGASLVARRGTVHAVLGENGAGKTTLMRVAYGLLAPDRGTMRVGGSVLLPRSPADAIAAGIGMVHQHYALVDAMRITENVALGNRGLFDERRIAARTTAVARESGLSVEPMARVEQLGVSARQRVEIVKALARDARVLILDEPTAVLPPNEAAELLRWIREFAASGHTAILITHKLRDALAVADDVTVLRMGRTVLTGTPRNLTADALAVAMLGEGQGTPVAVTSRIRRTADSPVIVDARGLALHDARGVLKIREATFVVRAGEIVAVAGVESAGHRELLRALAGRLAPAHGRLELPVSIGYVPEDRHRDGLILEMSVLDNIDLRDAGVRRGWRRRRGRAAHAARLLLEYDVRAGSPLARVATLSGGNQQKLILARELDPLPALLVAEHPSRGLDVRAAGAVRERLQAAADAGTAIVLASNDLDELASMAHRALVVHAGTVNETSPDARAIGRGMVGA